MHEDRSKMEKLLISSAEGYDFADVLRRLAESGYVADHIYLDPGVSTGTANKADVPALRAVPGAIVEEDQEMTILEPDRRPR